MLRTAAPATFGSSGSATPSPAWAATRCIGRLPGKQAQIPLIPASRLVRDFLPLKGHRGTFVREVALEREDVHLYRYGDQFIDAVSDFLWHDDRGRAFGMWRWLPDWSRDDTPALSVRLRRRGRTLSRCRPQTIRAANCVTVSAGMDQRALTRRADGIFPPIIVSVWMTAGCAGVDDQAHLEALAAPYAKPSPTSHRRRLRAEPGQDRGRLRTHSRSATGASPGEPPKAAAQRLVRGRDDVRAAVERATAIATGTRQRGCRSCACEPCAVRIGVAAPLRKNSIARK